MCICITSLTKTTHQMCCNCKLSHISKVTKKAVGVEFSGKEGGLDQIWGRGVGKRRGLHKIGRLGTLCQLGLQTKLDILTNLQDLCLSTTSKDSHSPTQSPNIKILFKYESLWTRPWVPVVGNRSFFQYVTWEISHQNHY